MKASAKYGSVAALVLALAWSRTASAQTTGGPYQYYTVAPCRLVDTRPPSLGANQFQSGVLQNVTVKGRCGIPSTAKAVALNLTVVSPTQDGFLIAWATGTTQPTTSNINFRAGEPALANGTLVGLATAVPDLSIIYGTAIAGTTHVLVDVVGYFQ